MNHELLKSYKDIEPPIKCPYKNDPDKEAIFREYDSPLAFLDLEKHKQESLLNWCESLDKVQKINKNYTSYGLKHIFQRSDRGAYVVNGAYKGAMLLAGFKVADETALNWQFDVSSKSIKEKIKSGSKSRQNN